MQIKTGRKKPTLTGALAALWCVKLRLGQHPIPIQLTEAEKPAISEIWEGKIG